VKAYCWPPWAPVSAFCADDSAAAAAAASYCRGSSEAPLRARSRLVTSPSHVAAFNAIAHIARLKVFFYLVTRRREVATGEIQEAVGIPGPTLSHHLDILRRAGLVVSRREVSFIYCSLLSACC
jgi:DNA-binding transcriptional ArsR family regulator